jgi:nucleoside 2-deoxyribosyltransferase
VLVYLAGAIDAVTRKEASTWRELFIAGAPLDWTCFSPVGAFQSCAEHRRTERNNKRIAAINRQAIMHCDVLVAVISPEAFGTIREIEFARKLHIPVIVIVTTLNNRVEYHDLHQVLSVDEAYEEILRHDTA